MAEVFDGDARQGVFLLLGEAVRNRLNLPNPLGALRYQITELRDFALDPYRDAIERVRTSND